MISVMTASVWLRGDQTPTHTYIYYTFLLLMSVVFAMGMAFLQSAAMALCTQLDTHGGLLGYLLTGQALHGVLSSLLNLLSTIISGGTTPNKVIYKQENARAALAVFVSTLVLQVVTWIVFARARYEPAVVACNVHDEPASNAPLTSGAWQRLVQVQQRIGAWSACLFGLFFVTLSVYPALTSRVHSVSSRFIWLQDPNVFVAVHIVVLNVGDLIGRRIPLLTPRLRIERVWVAMISTIARILFIPAFLACNRSEAVQVPLPDGVFFVLVFALGLTTGCFSTSFLISGPLAAVGTHRNAEASQFSDASALIEHELGEDAALASMLLSFWLVAGLTAGGIMSLVLQLTT